MLLDASTLPALARGCAILGAGGGGDTQVGLLAALQAVEDHGAVPLVDLEDLPVDGLIMPCGGVGAPTVSIEKIESGDEGGRLRQMVETLWDRPVVALMAGEIGGSNGIIPALWAAHLRLPVLDADGMGRAFPEIPQVTMEVAGISPNPAVMTDERGNVIVFRATDGDWMERIERAAAVEFGGMAWSSEYQLTVEQAKDGAVVNHAVSLAIRLGTIVAEAEHDPVEALAREIRAARLIAGKIVDVERRTTAGFVRGSATIEGLDEDAGRGAPCRCLTPAARQTMPSPDLRLGVDVGGTNTDAVVLDVDDQLIAKAKVPTTKDVTSGIEGAIAAVADRVDRERITHAMFGTTHATNAVLQRRGLRRVGVLRLAGPATKAIRPLFGWPADLRDVVSAGERIINGGGGVG